MIDTQEHKKMTSREKALARQKAKRERREAEINSRYDFIKSGKLTTEQNKIIQSDEYQNKWVHQEKRCFDRQQQEVSPYLTLRYRELTVQIVFFSMDIDWAIYHFESDYIRCCSK